MVEEVMDLDYSNSNLSKRYKPGTIVPGIVVYIKRHSSSSDRKRIVRRRLSITPDCRKTLVFSQKSQETCLQGSPPVHGRRPQCSNRQCKSPPSNVNVLSEGR